MNGSLNNHRKLSLFHELVIITIEKVVLGFEKTEIIALVLYPEFVRNKGLQVTKLLVLKLKRRT